MFEKTDHCALVPFIVFVQAYTVCRSVHPWERVSEIQSIKESLYSLPGSQFSCLSYSASTPCDMNDQACATCRQCHIAYASASPCTVLNKKVSRCIANSIHA